MLRPFIFCAIQAALIPSFILFASPYSYAAAENARHQKKVTAPRKPIDTRRTDVQCIHDKNQVAAALVAGDWLSLERLARAYISECDIYDDPKDIASMYGEIAVANNELKRSDEALKATEKCISLNYSDPGCHIQKSEALMQKGRLDDYFKEIEVAERLAEYALANAKEARDKATSKLDKEDHESEVSLYASQLNYIRVRRQRAVSGNGQ